MSLNNDNIMDMIDDDEWLTSYVKTSWLMHMMLQLEAARKQAGMTQGELADLLGTTSDAIVHIEADFDGNISLKDYIDWLLACGVVPKPLDTMTPADVKLEIIRKYVLR